MTMHVTSIAPETATNLAFDRRNEGHPVERNTATIGNFGNSFVNAGNMLRLVAPMHIRDLTVTAAAGNTITCSNLNWFDSYAAGFYVGGTLTVLRNVSDKLQQVGQTTITGASLKKRQSLYGGNAIAAGQSRIVWSPDSWEKPGAVKYFTLASIDATGKRSAWSAPVSFTYPAAPTNAQRTATQVGGANIDSLVQDAALPVPQNVTATVLNGGNSVQIDWTALAGHKVIVAWGWHSDVNAVDTETLTVANSGMIGAGDLVWLRKRFDHTVTKDVLSPRVFNEGSNLSRLRPHLDHFNGSHPQGVTYTYLEENGRPYIRYSVPAGVSFAYGFHAHSGSAQNWYNVPVGGRPYALRAEIRVSAARTVQMRMQDAPNQYRSLAATTGWQTFTEQYTFDTTPTTGNPLYSSLTVTGPCNLDVALFTMFDPAGEPMGLTSTIEQLSVDSGVLSLRMHATCKTKPWSYTMADLLDRYGMRATLGNSIPQSYFNLKAIRARNGLTGQLNPWTQVEPHMSDAELAFFGEYMCTPYVPGTDTPASKPGAYLRYSQGQSEPWQNVFERITLEIGNEPWNGLAEFYLLPSVNGKSPGWVNGKLLDRYADALMAAPGYDPTRWKFYLGGWLVSDSWNTDSVNASRHADFIGGADYNGGWDSGLTAALDADDPKAMFNTLANSSIPLLGGITRQQRTRSMAALCASLSAGRAKPVRLMHYESGPGYVLNGLNGASVTPAQAESQELLMKSVASGTGMLDAFMTCAAEGVVSNDFFTLEEGEYWKAKATAVNGGAYNPPFQWFCFINRHLVGKVRVLDLTEGEALLDPSGVKRGETLKCYAVDRADGSIAYVLCNIDPSFAHTIKLRRAPGAGRWTRYSMTGNAKTTNNTAATKDAVAIDEAQMPEAFGRARMDVTIPLGKAEVYIAPPA